MSDDTGTVLWGYKFLNVDLTTDDQRGGRFRYRLGEWMDADPQGREFTRGKLCPQFPGDGLCVARTLAGAQSGGARIGSSTMVLVGYRPDDVLCAGGDKLRVKRLFVHPDPQDPKAWLIGPGANLLGAYLRGADLGGAYLGGANLGGADLGGANLRHAYLRHAYLRDANLRDANLRDADLRGAYLGGADRPSWLPQRWGVDARGFVFEAPASGAPGELVRSGGDEGNRT